MSEFTQLLNAIEAGNQQAAAQLLPLVYDELRQLAAQKLVQEKPGQTLDATALVHEAYLRLVIADPEQPWNGRGHFFAAAAEAMRRILVENARRKKRLKHGGDCARAEMDLASLPTRMSSEEMLALNEALEQLHELDPINSLLSRYALLWRHDHRASVGSAGHLPRDGPSLLDLCSRLAAPANERR